MADLFKLAGRDVRVKEAEIALNVTPTSDATFQSITASNIKNSTLLAADENGKIIPSTTAYVTVATIQEISGQKTFTAPALANGEQPTTTFLTANGGRIIFGKEGPNSGSMIALEQENGTRRLNFRSSSTPGAMVWEQPESGSSLFYDVENVNFRGTNNVTGNGNFTWTLSGTNKFTVPYPGTVTPIISLGLQKISASANQYEFYKFNSTTNGVVLDLFTAPSIGVLKDGTYKNSLNIGDAVSGVILTSGNKGVSNGIASLDNNGKIPTAQIPNNYLDKGDSTSAAAQTVYNPVELKKPLVAPSIQGTKYTDYSGAQQSLFELGGTHSVSNGVSSGYGSLTLYRDRAGNWDSTSISYTLSEGLKIGDYGIGGPLSNNGTYSTNYLMTNKDGVAKTSFNGIKITSELTNTDDFVFESAGNGKLHSKMSSDSSGLVRGGWCINDKKIATVDVVRSTRDTLADHITAQAGGWIWLGKVAEKTYSLDLSEIRPGASGTTTGATCYVSINTFQQTVEGVTQYKTVIDATCRCEPFELKPIDVTILLSNVGSKWLMPRMLVSRGAMQSDAFTHMMAVLYADRAYVGMTVDECSVFRDTSTSLGNLNANGSVSPIYNMNADGFSLFAILMELDRDNENQNIPVSGAHYRVTLFHPNTVL